MTVDIETIKSELKEFLEISAKGLDPSVIASTLGEISRAVGLPKTADKIESLDWDSLQASGKTKVTATKSATKTKKAAKENDEEEEVFVKLLNGTIGRITGYPDEETALVSKGRGRPTKILIQELEEVNHKDFQFKQIKVAEDENEGEESLDDEDTPDEEDVTPKKRAKKSVAKIVKKAKVKAKPVELNNEISDWE